MIYPLLILLFSTTATCKNFPFFNKIVERTVEYGNDTVVQEGLLVYPVYASSWIKRPAVVVFHAFMGRTEFENEKARELAKLGYVAFAADTYGKGNAGSTVNENFAIMAAMLENRTTTLRTRILSSYDYVRGLDFVDTSNIGSIGFCYGGLCTLDLARFNVGLKAAVSFHGTLTDYPGNGTSIDASVQVHHGDEDTHTTNEDAESFIEEMRRRDGDWMFSRYAHAQHAFTLPTIDDYGIDGAKFNAIASNRSWIAMETFLAEKLLL